MSKNIKIILVVSFIFFIGVFLFIFLGNKSPHISKNEPQKIHDWVSVGDEYMEVLDTNLEEGADKRYKTLLYQNYSFLDESGNLITLSNANVTVKYPHREDFVDMPAEENAIAFLLYPTVFPAEYVFKVEREDGKIYEGTIDITEQMSGFASYVAGEERFEEDGVISQAYELEGIDMSDVEGMYHILPSGSTKKLGIPEDEYFWLKGTDALFGNHEIFVKKDGGWYRFSFLMVSAEDLSEAGI